MLDANSVAMFAVAVVVIASNVVGIVRDVRRRS